MSINVELGAITIRYGLDQDGDRVSSMEFTGDLDRIQMLGLLTLTQHHVVDAMYAAELEDEEDWDDD